MKLLKNIFAIALGIYMLTGSVEARFFSETEKNHIERYLEDNKLNRYGDAVGTMYAGGSPLFCEVTGQVIDRYEYIIRNHPYVLDDYVEILPIDAMGAVEKMFGKLQNGADGAQMADRFLDDLVNHEAENAILLDSLRRAIDRNDLNQVIEVLESLERMSDQRLGYFARTLRDVRRMVQMPHIQPIDVTAQLVQIRAQIERLQSRMGA
jgi:hypothetical protein